MLYELEKPWLRVDSVEPLLELEKPIVKPLVLLHLEVAPKQELSEAIVEPTLVFHPEGLPKQESVERNQLAVVKKDPQFLGIKASRWTAGALGLAVVDLIFRDPILMSIGVIGGLTKLAYPQLKKVGGKKWQMQLAAVTGTAAVAGLGLHLQISSAQALFFQEAETFLSSTFDLSGDAVGTIFNVFRAVYVVYLIYSAISIWTAYNRDEDWMSVAKAPIVIFVGGTLIDAVTTIITA